MSDDKGGVTGPALVRPGGAKFEVHELPFPVVTCEAAAEAKGIPLSAELKSLVVSTNCGVLLVHVSGADRLSLRRLKRARNLSQAYLAPPSVLHEMCLTEGTVCPFLSSLWTVPHVIDQRLLAQESVSTNAGTQTSYIDFSPRVLLSAPDSTIADVVQLKDS